MSCHTQDEIHGDGKTYKTRYAMPQLPKCENCHSGLENKNIYHKKHFNTFNCQTCHSQDYNNCGSCHVSKGGGHGGARIPSHIKFKIALNPLKTAPYSVDFNGRDNYKLATVRESLSAPDTWDNYGVTLENFDVFPTYQYTTPHNILRWTSRTDTLIAYDSTGFVQPDSVAIAHPSCSQACHIIKLNDGTLKNREFYLFNNNPNDEIQPSLNDWEINANKNIVVDDKLPARWEAK